MSRTERHCCFRCEKCFTSGHPGDCPAVRTLDHYEWPAVLVLGDWEACLWQRCCCIAGLWPSCPAWDNLVTKSRAFCGSVPSASPKGLYDATSSCHPGPAKVSWVRTQWRVGWSLVLGSDSSFSLLSPLPGRSCDRKQAFYAPAETAEQVGKPKNTWSWQDMREPWCLFWEDSTSSALSWTVLDLRPWVWRNA